MINRPTRQTELRPARLDPTRHRVSVALSGRLTSRDRWILRMLCEHRVLTTIQLADLAFPTEKLARRRLLKLSQAGVVDRFRPLRPVGSAPAHWFLAPAGAAVLAAEIGVEVREFGYRHERALALAHSLRLAHTIGVNEWFTALATAHHDPGDGLVAWWSEIRCLRLWGDLVRPDGYGRYTHGDHTVEFFLEYDLATENHAQVARKALGYAELARTTGITTPLLIWTPTQRRETALRRTLAQSWAQLPDPGAVPVATAAADLLEPAPTSSPADRVWLPLDTGAGRVELRHLPNALPRTAATSHAGQEHTPATASGRPRLAPPPPFPPPVGES